jgi:dihydroorotate dehydrogenase
MRALHWAGSRELLREAIDSFCRPDPLPVEVLGLRFPNPIGLAAGMDKEAMAAPVWEALGFGFCELGGVTWHPQPGNPQPRLFRAVADEALINRMGFNNPGAAAMAAKLSAWKAAGKWPSHPVGINLGKSKITPNPEAAEDYARSFEVLWPLADFFVVNVSSPNTPNLRRLQDKAALDEILAALGEINGKFGRSSEFPEKSAGLHSEPNQGKPILVKVAPDLSFEALDEILELAGPRELAGIVATNTTLARPETTDPDLGRIYAESGGLSGGPLRERSTEVIRHLYRQSEGKLPIIGVGGILNGADAWEKILAGASLLQIYTGLVYEGPGLVKELIRNLRERLAERNLKNISEAVGMGS